MTPPPPQTADQRFSLPIAGFRRTPVGTFHDQPLKLHRVIVRSRITARSAHGNPVPAGRTGGPGPGYARVCATGQRLARQPGALSATGNRPGGGSSSKFRRPAERAGGFKLYPGSARVIPSFPVRGRTLAGPGGRLATAEALTIEARHDRDYPIVTVAGEIDIATAARLRERLSELAVGGPLVADLDLVGFIDSAGLAALVGAANRAAAHGGSLHVVCARPKVRQLFRLTGLDRRLPQARTLDEALDALMAVGARPASGR